MEDLIDQVEDEGADTGPLTPDQGDSMNFLGNEYVNEYFSQVNIMHLSPQEAPPFLITPMSSTGSTSTICSSNGG